MKKDKSEKDINAVKQKIFEKYDKEFKKYTETSEEKKNKKIALWLLKRWNDKCQNILDKMPDELKKEDKYNKTKDVADFFETKLKVYIEWAKDIWSAYKKEGAKQDTLEGEGSSQAEANPISVETPENISPEIAENIPATGSGAEKESLVATDSSAATENVNGSGEASQQEEQKDEKTEESEESEKDNNKFVWSGISRELIVSTYKDGKVLYPGWNPDDLGGCVKEEDYGKEKPDADPDVLDGVVEAVMGKWNDIFNDMIPAIAKGKELVYTEDPDDKEEPKNEETKEPEDTKQRPQDKTKEELKNFEDSLKYDIKLIKQTEKERLAEAEKEAAKLAIDLIIEGELQRKEDGADKNSNDDKERETKESNIEKAKNEALKKADNKFKENLKKMMDNEKNAYDNWSKKLIDNSLKTAQGFFNKSAKQMIDVYDDKRNDEKAFVRASNLILRNLVKNVEQLMKSVFGEIDKRIKKQTIKSKTEAMQKQLDDKKEKIRENAKKESDKLQQKAIKQKNKAESAIKKQLGKLDAIAGK